VRLGCRYRICKEEGRGGGREGESKAQKGVAIPAVSAPGVRPPNLRGGKGGREREGGLIVMTRSVEGSDLGLPNHV